MVAVPWVNKSMKSYEIDKRIRVVACATHSGRYGLVFHLATRASWAHTGETSHTERQKASWYSFKMLGKRSKTNASEWNVSKTTLRLPLFISLASYVAAKRKLVKVNIFYWLGRPQNVKLLENECVRVVISKNLIPQIFEFLGGILHTKTQDGFLLFCVFF